MRDIMYPTSQSYLHLTFIFIEINFYSLSFLSDFCNEVISICNDQVNKDEMIL